MWKIKRFKSFSDLLDWNNRNYRRYQIVELFVHNGYAVEYKLLRRVY